MATDEPTPRLEPPTSAPWEPERFHPAPGEEWLRTGFDHAWGELSPIGADPVSGGYHRHGWNQAELACRAWFRGQAAERSMTVEQDGNGNLWAWWGAPSATDAVVTGSHLDSVPNGGAYDGPLGVVAGFLAVDLLRAREIKPRHPVAVVAWAEEEGARFGLACLGSRLATGRTTPDQAAALTDPDGVTLGEAMRAAGTDPDELGPTPRRLERISALVELHIEQGRGLVDLGAPVGMGTAIWPHGRWRLELTGAADHAGTSRLADRHDPMLTFANTVLSARKKARLADAVATIGRVEVQPNGINAVPERVRAWLDARAPDEDTLRRLVDDIADAVVQRAGRDGTEASVVAESATSPVEFDPTLRELIGRRLGAIPTLTTAAGHDAGILAETVPTAMLFVRNPTGASHTPREHATGDDCLAGVDALAAVLEELVTR